MSSGPRVLAFVRSWSGAPDGDDLAIRAQLRGLGAALDVYSDAGMWTYRADDATELTAGDREAIERRFGVEAGTDALFVIDERDNVRFAHRAAGQLELALVPALARANDSAHTRSPLTFSRREWMTSCLVGGFSVALLASCRSKDAPAPAPAALPPPEPIHELEVVLDVNGQRHTLQLEPRVSLLDALRERLGLTGSKKGCDAGQCGACTVLVGGQRVLACLTLAVMAQGKPITTIEGLATGDQLHPVQAAFVEHDALQCGFCTPGQICSAVGLLAEQRATTDDDIREQMSGNICRCGAYPNIVAAIQAARVAPGKVPA
jgi:xanthine dehydrogenase YagT iron-sulfur-binding subunit